MSWHSRAKDEKIASETKRLRLHLSELQQAIKGHAARLVTANAAMAQLQGPAETLIATTQLAKRELLPVPVLSFCVRQVRSWLGGDFYRDSETAMLDRLNAAILDFEAIWRSDTAAGDRPVEDKEA
jgi:hypothetical protein